MKKIYFCSLLIINIFILSVRLFAQESQTDSCTIYISTGYYGNNGWNNSYLQLLQQGHVIATVQHQQWTPETYSVTVPANEKTDFNWIADNTQVSFYILSSAGEILYNFRNSSQSGIFFSYYVCSAPHNVSNIRVTPNADGMQGAIISWTNPTQTVNNDLLQTIDSIVLLKNDVVMTTLYNLTPGTDTQYTDLSFQTSDYYTVITYNGSAESSPLNATGPSCRYRLVMETGWSNWFSAMLRFSSKGHCLGEFSLPHHGSETQYVYIPKGWITIEHQGINGTFTLYDEDNNLVLSGPSGLPERFQWYNGCSLAVPDTATALSNSVQNNVVNLFWTNPAISVNGDTLTAISKVEVRRNEELIHSFTETVPGGQLSFTDTTPSDGTYLYAVQCFNETGGGIPAFAHITTGSNWTLHDFSNNGLYTDTTCMVSITNDASYTNDGILTVTVYQSDTTKMLRISGSLTYTDGTSISVYAGSPENGVRLSPDTLCMTTTFRSASFVMDIPAGSSPQFHYTLECVDPVYEQPDTNIAIMPDNNGIIYVTQEGAGLRNGSSWTNATPWLNRALATADTMTERPVIWVAAGIYYGNPQMVDNKTYAFVGRDSLNVYGGFVGNEPADYNLALRDFEQKKTILDGLLAHTVVYLGNASEWNGFHIQRGANGCKMLTNSVIRHCIVSECKDDGVTAIEYSNAIVDSCRIMNNNGNGIAVGSINMISNTLVSRNGGTGIQAGGTIKNCEVLNNGGSGIRTIRWMGWNKIGIVNCVVANNNGDGVEDYSGEYNLTNLTVVNNNGNGITTLNTVIRNSIVNGNGGESIGQYYYNTSYTLIHCAVEGNYIHSSHNNIPLVPNGNTSGFNPGFVNPTTGRGKDYDGGDWHLLPTSVCVNRGMSNWEKYPATDLEGNARIQQGTPDIGAYESNFEHPDAGKIIYVKANSNGDGSSWSNATADLDNAIESAWVYGSNTQIWVAQGTYPTPGHSYYLKEYLHLIGGFVGDEPADYDIDLRNTLEHVSILDGQQQNRVLYQTIDFEQPALVDGFTLTHGQADEGAGAYLMSNTTLSKCRIVNNAVTGENAAAVIAVRDTLKQLLVENNEGTGVHAINSQVLHCTVVRNNGEGIQVSVNSIQDSGKLCNNIIWGNALQNLHFTSFMAQKNTPVMHCAIENQVVDGEHNIILSSDNENGSGPHFINPTDSVSIVTNMGDWQIDSSSVCVNAGTELSDLYSIHTDLAGEPQIQNEKPDIGAMESPYSDEVLCRNMEILIYEGGSYTFYDTTLTTTGWYKRRWNVGNADSLVVLHLITKHVTYVSETGAGNRDGSSWANALDGQTATANGSTKLADALQTATVGTEFWIQSGMYYACSDSDINKSLILNSGVALYGGFAGTETAISQRDPNNAPTVFSGNLQNDSIIENHTRYILKTNERNTPDNPILLDNISITEGYNDIHVHEGCALRVNVSSSVKANHCRIHHNFGGAVVNEGLFTGYYCTLDSNESYCDYWDSDLGAAAIINRSTGLANINNCVVDYNQAPTDGAIFNNGILWIDSSQINHNQATSGTIGAIRNEGLLTIFNSHLSYNKSYEEYSIIASSGPLKMDNCTLEYNQTNMRNPLYYWPREMWAAIYSSAHIMVSGNADVTHCLFRRNTQNAGNGGGCLHVNGRATIQHCDFVENIGALNSGSSFVTWGDGEENPSSGGLVIHLIMETGYIDGGGINVSCNEEVYVEDCLFDGQIGKHGSAACVGSGKLIMNRCKFTRNIANSDRWGGALSVQGGELCVLNSLFANNHDGVFNTEVTINSKTTFSNCTFANNGNRFCYFGAPRTPYECDTSWVNNDTAHVNFDNCIIMGNWNNSMGGECSDCGCFYPNYTVNFTNTLFDTLHTVSQTAKSTNLASQTISIVPDSETDEIPTISLADAQSLLTNQPKGNLMVRYNAELQDFVGYSNTVMSEKKGPVGEKSSAKDGSTSDCTPDSLGNIYYCDPMFVNPTTVVGVDSAQNPLLYDFRLQDGSPAINSGDTTGLHLMADATDLDGERRIKQCQIDRGCYEYGTVVYDTILETVCVEPESLNQYSYTGHGFTLAQLKVGENSFTRNCDCHTDANDTVLTLQLFVSLIQQTEDEAVACDSLLWHDEIFRASGDYTRTFANGMGCDSVVTMHLTVKTSSLSEFSDTVCGSYTWNDETYTESGDYTQTLTNAAGCDSVVTLHLTVHHEVDTVIYDYFCNGSTYPFFGQNLSFAGTYTHTGQTEYGCDSTITLHLEMKQIYYAYLDAHLCDGEGYDFFGETLYATGTYTQVLPTVYGCDSTIYLTLTTGNTTYGQLEASICEGNSYYFHGQILTTEGVYIDTITNASGCDSVITLHLTINPTASSTSSATICDRELPYVWNGLTFSEAGTQSLTLQTVNGCDSVVEMTLSVNPSVTIEESLTINESDLPFTYSDTTFMPGTVQSGDYIFYFTTTDGCDSIIILHLTVETGISSYDLSASMNVYPNPTNDIINVQLTMNNEQLNNVEIQVFDMYGKLLDNVNVSYSDAKNHVPTDHSMDSYGMANAHGASSKTTQIDLSHYANGVYFIKAVSDGNVLAVRKVVKNK